MPKLTDTEIRKVFKLFEQDKSLPDKYRFLLFDDKRDYLSVDFNFESKREIIREKDEASGKVEEKWTGDFVFENKWQSFCTKKERSLELKTPFHECEPGRYKIAVKVVDIFDSDTMKIIDVGV